MDRSDYRKLIEGTADYIEEQIGSGRAMSYDTAAEGVQDQVETFHDDLKNYGEIHGRGETLASGAPDRVAARFLAAAGEKSRSQLVRKAVDVFRQALREEMRSRGYEPMPVESTDRRRSRISEVKDNVLRVGIDSTAPYWGAKVKMEHPRTGDTIHGKLQGVSGVRNSDKWEVQLDMARVRYNNRKTYEVEKGHEIMLKKGTVQGRDRDDVTERIDDFRERARRRLAEAADFQMPSSRTLQSALEDIADLEGGDPSAVDVGKLEGPLRDFARKFSDFMQEAASEIGFEDRLEQATGDGELLYTALLEMLNYEPTNFPGSPRSFSDQLDFSGMREASMFTSMFSDFVDRHGDEIKRAISDAAGGALDGALQYM